MAEVYLVSDKFLGSWLNGMEVLCITTMLFTEAVESSKSEMASHDKSGHLTNGEVLNADFELLTFYPKAHA